MEHLKVKLLLLVMGISLFFVACDNEDDAPAPTVVNFKVYQLGAVGTSGVTGTATIIEKSDATLSVELELKNTVAGALHPAHIHLNTAAEGGDIALTLKAVDGTTGKSTTTFKALDNGTAIMYQELLNFDGYINVHLSASNLATLVAQGDIGQNQLTGVSKVYPLGSVAVPAISGTATFFKRVNGEALAVVQLQNTANGASHPGHIHANTAAQGGGIVFSFKPVTGGSGLSVTNISKLDNGTAFGYDQLLTFNGYINFHQSTTDLGTLVAQGDIGQNELTGKKVSYVLAQKDVAGISGTVEFAERLNLTTLVTIKLIGTTAGASHPAHIHENNVVMGGNIIAGLNPVNGTTGISKTQVATLVGGAAVTYTQFLTLAAYVNAHLSEANMATIVAQGNVGSSVGSGAGTVETKTYTVTNSGSSSYIFNGEGLTNASNPNLTLRRGGTYTFNVDVPGHPFYINTVQGTGTANVYNSGVTGNGAVNGMVKIVVPSNAPNTLYYNCEFHGMMTGIITITN
ncbi:CHRD domain-containing protein [Flavobacterium sp. LS2R12]|uniref:CHRD domain-containing protein n=1 Tax=unclassified Flavobacterium TaxID=196869 RepID=UPI003AB0964E